MMRPMGWLGFALSVMDKGVGRGSSKRKGLLIPSTVVKSQQISILVGKGFGRRGKATSWGFWDMRFKENMQTCVLKGILLRPGVRGWSSGVVPGAPSILCHGEDGTGRRNWGTAPAEKAGGEVGRAGELLRRRRQKTRNPPRVFAGLNPWLMGAVSDTAAGWASRLGFAAMLFGSRSAQGRSDGW